MELKIALAQINPVMGDLKYNAQKIITTLKKVPEADLVVFPELSICGYPPEDLLLKPSFLQQCQIAVETVCESMPKDIVAIIGVPVVEGESLFNMALALKNGKVIAKYAKQRLPNYGVFDEERYFKAGNKPVLIFVNGVQCALTICEDLWYEAIALQAKDAGAELLINMNASPFRQNKSGLREETMSQQAKTSGLPLVYVNQVGGQDELVFDGGSFVLNAQGEKVHALDLFEEEVSICCFSQALPLLKNTAKDNLTETYQALVLGTQDYVLKNGFSKVVLGLSGGIDSALTLCIAVDALGAENVEVLMMPSRYNLDISLEDAQLQADKLGVASKVVSIEPMFKSFLASVEFLKDKEPNVVEENIQARVRGITLMARSNQTGAMLLTTGNKSEMSIGYATLYGDMAGGFAPIKDVYKTLVFELSTWINRHEEIIPERVITRPPTAELSFDQKDSDSLPDYPLLDSILHQYIEERKGRVEIGVSINDKDLADKIVRMVDRSEYKRRQAPPGVRVTVRAYGKDRRYPIVNRFNR